MNKSRYQFRDYHLGQVMITLMLAFLFSGCKIDNDKNPDAKKYNCINSDQSGYEVIEDGSVVREFILHVPSSYNSNTPCPLIINFHGYGGCASKFSKEVGDLNSVANSESFIVAYPQAIVREKGAAYWDPGDNESQNIEENDVYFTEQLILHISDEYNVDLSRVYAIGYSNGGMMAYGLACSGGNFISAIGIMSGIMLPGSCSPDEYTSVIHFHGFSDEVLPYKGNKNYQSVSEMVNFWLNHNSIQATSLVTTALNDGYVLRESYEGGKENTAISLYTVHELNGKAGGHEWFTGDIDGNSPNEILWDFLSAYSLDD